MYHQIDQEMEDTARICQAFVCYGTIGWEDDNYESCKTSSEHQNNTFYIRQKVVNSSGLLVASYDKIHLCDYGDCRETRFFTPGRDVSSGSFDCQGWKLGLIVCADIRYPLLCRQVVLNDYIQEDSLPPSSVLDTCQVILQPACFSRDLSFRTWKSFRETRAVENAVYFVGTNYAGSYYGESSVIPPWVDENHEPLIWNTESGVFEAVLEKDALLWAREQMPYYRFLIQDRFYPKSNRFL